MREWPGMRDDQSQVGSDGLTTSIGVSYDIDGELSRRPGETYLWSSGGIALGTFRQVQSGSWIVWITFGGFIHAYNVDTGLAHGFSGAIQWNTTKTPLLVPFGPRLYMTNDFNRMQVWDGITETSDAGMDAPAAAMGNPSSTSAGSTTAGVHLIRYRYLDSKSPGGSYASNPSDANEYTVAAGGKTLSFSITASGGGGPIIRSDDIKCDTIQVEMTAAAGNVYYVAGTVRNSATSIIINMADEVLILQDDVDVEIGNFGHEKPPIGSCLFECRGYAFLCGTTKRNLQVQPTALSTTVAIPFSDASLFWAGRLIRLTGESTVYEIASVTSAASIELTEAYAGALGGTIVFADVYAKDPNLAYWSDQYMPESWKALVRARQVLSGVGDQVVAGCDFQGDAWFFGQRSMGRLVFADDPANGEVNPVPGYHGLWNARCLMLINGILMGWGPNGGWKITGGAPILSNKAIAKTVDAMRDRTYSDKFHAAYDPVNKLVLWYFVRTGETVPRDAMVYDLLGDRWYRHRYRHPIDASATVADTTGRLRLVLSDGDNELLWTHEGDNEGLPTGCDGVFTVAPGSTATTIAVNETPPVSADYATNLWYRSLYRPATGEERIIYDMSTSTIDIDSAFATSVVVGEAIYVGAIPTSILSAWWVDQDLGEKKRPHLHLLFGPDSDALVRVKVYRDYQTSPHTWTRNADDVFPDAVDIVDGRNYIEVDTSGSATAADGFVSIPMPSDWGRAWRAELLALSPAGTLQLLDMRFLVDGRRDAGKDTDG